MAEKFIKITKDGETIQVHPSVVDDHKRLGWQVVETKSEPEPESEEDKAAKKKAAAEVKAKKEAEAKAIGEAKGNK